MILMFRITNNLMYIYKIYSDFIIIFSIFQMRPTHLNRSGTKRFILTTMQGHAS